MNISIMETVLYAKMESSTRLMALPLAEVCIPWDWSTVGPTIPMQRSLTNEFLNFYELLVSMKCLPKC